MNNEENYYLLSIIIPVYNCEMYVADCINSLIAADVNSLVQIILVDDGSTDASGNICDEYGRRYSNIYPIHKNNEGPSAARNLGIKEARGKYIGFADSDDFVIPDRFKKTAEIIRNIDFDVLVTDFYRVNGKGSVVKKVFQIEGDNLISSGDYRKIYLSKPDCFWNVWRYIYKKDYLISNGIRFTNGISCGEDLEFSVHALMASSKLSFYHNPYYCYRTNYGQSLMHDASPVRTWQLLEMLKRTQSGLLRIGSEESELILAKISREYILNLFLYAEGKKSDKKKILNYLKASEYLMDYSKGVYRYASVFIRIFGIRVSSYILFFLKNVKKCVTGICHNHTTVILYE